MNTLRAIKTIAMAAVVSESDDYNLRFVKRWYSKTFCTPLADVDGIPLDDILQTYFETRYEEMSDADRREEIARLVETEAEGRRRLREEDRREAEDAEFQLRVTQEAKKAAQAPKPQTPMSEAVNQVQGALAGLAAAVKAIQGPDKPQEGLKSSDLPVAEPQAPPPDIKLNFLDDDSDFFDEPGGPRPPKKAK